MTLRALVYPYLVAGVAATRRMIAEPPPGGQWAAWVAVSGGEPVGWVCASRLGDGTGETALLHVHPDHRRQGIGAELYATAVDHLRPLGVSRLRTWAQPGSLGFARRLGYTPSRDVHYASLRLRPTPPAPPVPDGVRLLPLAAFDPLTFHPPYAAACADEPGDVPPDVRDVDNWRYDVWDDPGLDRTASTVAVVDGEVAAFTLVLVDGERMWSGMTGTLPAYRGRGLAGLVKRAALRRAAGRGVVVAYTSNDAGNAPMLAVNRSVGYRRVDVQWSCLADPPSAATC